MLLLLLSRPVLLNGIVAAARGDWLLSGVLLPGSVVLILDTRCGCRHRNARLSRALRQPILNFHDTVVELRPVELLDSASSRVGFLVDQGCRA